MAMEKAYTACQLAPHDRMASIVLFSISSHLSLLKRERLYNTSFYIIAALLAHGTKLRTTAQPKAIQIRPQASMPYQILRNVEVYLVIFPSSPRFNVRD